MSRALKIYIGLLVVLLIGIVVVEMSTPSPVNWQKTYNEKDKIPYGTYVFYNELESLFPDSRLYDITVTPYEYFDALYNWEDDTYDVSGNFVAVDEYVSTDDVSIQELLDFASHGNTVFLSSTYMPMKFSDSLGFETTHDYDFDGKAELSFANPKFSKDSISIEKGATNIYFSEIDTLNTTVLGHQKFKDSLRVNFINVPYGSGNLLLHLQPMVFTNYHLLKKENKKYSEVIMSYLEDKDIYFDSKNKYGASLSRSPLRFINSQPALRWAWYMVLIVTILFMIFNAKRRQRIVKQIESPRNTTVEFTKTIGNLYYETKDHTNLIDKKITYFLEHLRRVYYLDTQLLNEKFIKNLALKSGKREPEIKKLINLIVHLRAKSVCNEGDLLRLNKMIEEFKK